MLKKYVMNLHLFDEGGQGGDGGQGNPGGNGNGSQGNAGGTTYTYQQAEEIASARAQRAEQAALKSFFQQQGMSEDEITDAVKKFKEDREKNKPNLSAIEMERDNAIKELAQAKNEKYLSDKGVKTEDLDYVMFKIEKLVDDKTDFKKASEKFLKENPKFSGAGGYRVSASTGTETQGSGGSLNSSINNAIRMAVKR